MKKNENGKCLINNKEYIIDQVTMDNSFVFVDENVELFYNIFKYNVDSYFF